MAVSGFFASLANTFPMMTMLPDMDKKGITLNFAFTCCAGFVFGDHLGFCASQAPHMILPMVVAKLSGAILAVFIANKAYQIVVLK